MKHDAFFDRLMEQLGPHRPASDQQARQAQIFCGRYLALRRLGKGLTLEQLAARVELPPNVILFLETGLADATLATDDHRMQLAQALAADPLDVDWMGIVLATALGQVAEPDEAVMARVIDELNLA